MYLSPCCQQQWLVFFDNGLFYPIHGVKPLAVQDFYRFQPDTGLFSRAPHVHMCRGVIVWIDLNLKTCFL
jgi:hypothetical protein